MSGAYFAYRLTAAFAIPLFLSSLLPASARESPQITRKETNAAAVTKQPTYEPRKPEERSPVKMTFRRGSRKVILKKE